MRVGVVSERKAAEGRVALTPAGAAELRNAHDVLVEAGAGERSGFTDQDFERAGAEIVAEAAEVWERSELVAKVKEPIESEYRFLRPGLTLFAYLHLAADAGLARALADSGAVAIAYETVEDSTGGLPLLAPMSEIAGRLAAQATAYFLQAPQGGCGLLAGGSPGVAAAKITVIGGGVVGTNAARMAIGLESEVTILERSAARVRRLDELFGRRARVLMSDAAAVGDALAESDAVIGAVLVPGAKAPQLINRAMLGMLGRRSVIVDVAIDQGGCFATSRPTTHDDPTYEVDGVLHYCVANMPGAVPVTATKALTNSTFPYLRRLSDLGINEALEQDPGLNRGLAVRDGEIVHGPTRDALELGRTPAGAAAR
jgi:alanine dehydrogenase